MKVIRALITFCMVLVSNLCNADVEKPTLHKRHSITDNEYTNYILDRSKMAVNQSIKKEETSKKNNERFLRGNEYYKHSNRIDPRKINSSVIDIIDQPIAGGKVRQKNAVTSNNSTERKNETAQNTKSEEGDQETKAKNSKFKIPKVSSREGTDANKPKTFFGLGASVVPYGNATISGSETLTQGGSKFHTFTGDVEYLPMFDISMRVGKNIPAYKGGKVPAFYRLEFEVSYTRLSGSPRNITKASNYPTSGTASTSTTSGTSAASQYPSDPTSFGLPSNYGSANLFNFSLNGIVDMVKWGPGYPYIGGGVGFGVMYFEENLRTALVAPTFSIFAGYLFTVGKKLDISIGYKLTILYPTTYSNDFVVPINGNITRTVIDNFVDFGPVFIHKIEFVFWFF